MLEFSACAGDASGPTHPSNPTGTGQKVIDGLSGGSGTVDFTPFLPDTFERSGTCVNAPAPALSAVGLLVCALALLLLGTISLARVRRPTG